jgi:hypothetical protein
MECWERYNKILEATIGYARACSVPVIYEVVFLNERMDVNNARVEELNRRAVTGEMEELRRGSSRHWRWRWSLIVC